MIVLYCTAPPLPAWKEPIPRKFAVSPEAFTENCWPVESLNTSADPAVAVVRLMPAALSVALPLTAL